MQYLLMIYTAPDSGEPQPGSDGWDAYLDGYRAMGEEAAERGVMRGGNALMDVGTATTVRVRGEKIETTDGPFAETREVLGGYYLLDCRDLDEAIEFAAKIPGARYGSIEVRPIMELD